MKKRGTVLVLALVSCGRVPTTTAHAKGSGEDAAVLETDAAGQVNMDSSFEAEIANDAAGVAALLSGELVDMTTIRPLAGRTVWIAGQQTTTNANGQFSFSNVPSRYDVIVVEPAGDGISVYKNLMRRDPVLPHRALHFGSHWARLAGDVAGGGNYPLSGSDSVIVYFFSDEADQSFPLSGALSTLQAGPAYGDLPLTWDGPSSVSGQLAALGQFRAADGSTSIWFTSRAMAVADGQTALANVALAPVTAFAHVAGNILLPPDATILQKRLFYRLHMLHARIGLPSTPLSRFDDMVPDLAISDAELCAGALAVPGSLLTERCGVSLSPSELTITVQPSPSFSSPAGPGTVAKASPFSWTAFDAGVYVLEFEPHPEATPTSPRIDVYTSDTTAVWPDLTGFGIGFPVGMGYRCSIGGLGPYTSIDEAMGPSGVGAPFPAESRRSFSPPIDVTLGP